MPIGDAGSSLEFGYRIRPSAFTLVELLAVITIISLLAVFATSGWGWINAAALQNAAILVGETSDYAQELARKDHSQTALAIVKTGPDAYRKMAILECGTSGTWSTVTKWYLLPNGIIFDFSDTTANFFGSCTNSIANPIQMSGSSLSVGLGFAAQEFGQDGSLMGQNAPLVLRLRQGFLAPSGSSVTYTAPVSRYFDLVLIPTGGRAKYVQP